MLRPNSEKCKRKSRQKIPRITQKKIHCWKIIIPSLIYFSKPFKCICESVSPSQFNVKWKFPVFFSTLLYLMSHLNEKKGEEISFQKVDAFYVNLFTYDFKWIYHQQNDHNQACVWSLESFWMISSFPSFLNSSQLYFYFLGCS